MGHLADRARHPLHMAHKPANRGSSRIDAAAAACHISISAHAYLDFIAKVHTLVLALYLCDSLSFRALGYPLLRGVIFALRHRHALGAAQAALIASVAWS